MEFYAVDPNETFTLDFSRESAKFALAARKRALAAAKTDEDRKVLERLVAEAELAFQTLRPGAGPVFTVGLIPGAKRHEIEGLSQRLASTTDAEERRRLDYAWMSGVVRHAIRGHTNLKRRDGTEVPFAGEDVVVDGARRTVPSAEMVETYYQSGMLGILAILAWEPQQLGGDGKNA